MKFDEVIKKRRAYRLLEKTDISDEMIRELATAASLAPSCSNSQPWKFIFIKDEDILEEMEDIFSEENEWAEEASLIVVPFSTTEDDCVIGKREYDQFDTGISTGFMMLKATEMGLVAHPIAGFNPRKLKRLLDIPGEANLLSIIIIGKHADLKNYKQYNRHELEDNRPLRHELNKFIFIDKNKISFEG